MDNKTKIAVYSIIFSLVAAIVYFFVSFFDINWRYLLYALYCVGIVLYLLGIVLFVITSAKGSLDNNFVNDWSSTVLSKILCKGLMHLNFSAYLGLIGGSMLLFSSSLLWPLELFYQLKLSKIISGDLNFKKGFVGQMIFNKERYYSSWTMVFTVILLFMDAYVSSSEICLFLMLLIIIHILIRHTSYLLSSLPDRLRKSNGNPYLLLVNIIVSDFVSLVAAYTCVKHQPKYSIGLISGAYGVIDGLFSFSNISNIIASFSLSQKTAMMISGFLFYTTLISIFLRKKEFVRTDDDIREIANGFLLIGRFNEGIKWLDKVTTPGRTDQLLKATAFLGVNSIDKAMEISKLTTNLNTSPQMNSDDTFYILTYGFLMYPIPSDVCVNVLIKGMVIGASDLSIIFCIDTLILRGYDKNIFSRLIPFIGSNNSMLQVYLLLIHNQWDNAKIVFDAISPLSAIEKLTHYMLALELGLYNPYVSSGGMPRVYDEWYDRIFQHLSENTNKITLDAEIKLMLVLLLRIKNISKTLERGHEEVYDFLIENNKNRMINKDLGEEIINLAIRLLNN